ncbi:MAG: hypothetical protein EZS28_012653 [Streblomastix strix]|uniref:Uncharacterized protein n=1 Tax=Streblomastix strix TaxID=222440 RepID=A0A5J4WAY7_9EUKA|nr:MAG: hypothetical protein EZS28_012653 [Streblomastix strix]
MRMGQITRKNLYDNIGVASRLVNQFGMNQQQLNVRVCWWQPISDGEDATQRRFMQIVDQQRVRMVTWLSRECYSSRATGQGQESEGAAKGGFERLRRKDVGESGFDGRTSIAGGSQ